MTTDQFSGKGIKYTLEDKFFWAAVFNLARHNAFITINHINQQLGIKPIENDQDINSIKLVGMQVLIAKTLKGKQSYML